MDINFLPEREQTSLKQAKAADSVEARLAHEALARRYAERLHRTTCPHADRSLRGENE